MLVCVCACVAQALFSEQSADAQQKMTMAASPEDEDVKMDPSQVYTLEQYSTLHFRTQQKKMTKSLSKSALKRKDTNLPWGFTRVSVSMLYSAVLYIHMDGWRSAQLLSMHPGHLRS